MQTASYTVNSGSGVALWRGIPAQITIAGIEDVSGDWLFLVDNDLADGVILSGTVAADGETLVVTLAEMNTVELAEAIQGRPLLQCRATLTDGVSRVYILPLIIKNRAISGTPTPVAEYYTKAQIDAIIAAIPTAPVQSVNGKTGAVELTAADVGALPASGQTITASGAEITPAHDGVYRHTLAANDEITIDTTGLSSSVQVTFELHLVQPATAVTFTLPAGVLWADGDSFASGNAAPTLDTANTLYCLVFRWDGANLLGNLAYSKAVTA